MEHPLKGVPVRSGRRAGTFHSWVKPCVEYANRYAS